MAEFTDCLTPDHIAMIAAQPVFFVATAAADGRIHLSPKGLDDTLKVLSPTRIAFLDLGGLGQRNPGAPIGRRAHHPDDVQLPSASTDLAHLWARHARD